jgi:Lon protease-like protein
LRAPHRNDRQLSSNLPLFPLNTVLFPGGRLPLRIFEQRYMDMAKACLKDGSPFGVCLIREGREVGEPAIPADVGTLARIATWDMPQLGVLQVLAVGSQRFRIRERRVAPGGLARGDVELMDADQDAAIPQSCARCVKILQRVVDEQPELLEPPQMASASWVGSRLAELLPLPLEAKQELLELTDARTRLERLNALLGG